MDSEISRPLSHRPLLRFLARFIDGMILGMAGLILRLLMLGMGTGRGYSFGMTPALEAAMGVSLLVNFLLGMAYEVYFVSTRGATPGKMALGLKIVRPDGAPVDAGLALGRYFAALYQRNHARHRLHHGGI